MQTHQHNSNYTQYLQKNKKILKPCGLRCRIRSHNQCFVLQTNAKLMQRERAITDWGHSLQTFEVNSLSAVLSLALYEYNLSSYIYTTGATSDHSMTLHYTKDFRVNLLRTRAPWPKRTTVFAYVANRVQSRVDSNEVACGMQAVFAKGASIYIFQTDCIQPFQFEYVRLFDSNWFPVKFDRRCVTYSPKNLPLEY